MNTAQKNISGVGSTQKFTEIKDIKENIVLFNNGDACLIIEVRASNFALLSKEEQDGKVFAYASLLNSLSFPIQILVRSKKLDIGSYLKLLDEEIHQTATPKENMTQEHAARLSNYISLYRDFVAELVKVNVVLDKKFYIVIPYSYLEKSIISQQLQGGKPQDHVVSTLQSKAQSVLNQLSRLNLGAVILEKEELIKLMYSVYNGDLDEAIREENIKAPLVKGRQ